MFAAKAIFVPPAWSPFVLLFVEEAQATSLSVFGTTTFCVRVCAGEINVQVAPSAVTGTGAQDVQLLVVGLRPDGFNTTMVAHFSIRTGRQAAVDAQCRRAAAAAGRARAAASPQPAQSPPPFQPLEKCLLPPTGGDKIVLTDMAIESRWVLANTGRSLRAFNAP